MNTLIRHFLFLLILQQAYPSFPQVIHQRDLLSKNYSPEVLKEIYSSESSWNPFPAYENREAWNSLPGDIIKKSIQTADLALEYQWPTLPATLYLEYTRTGNRSLYEGVYFERRKKLADLVVGEMISGHGKYLDQIINGLWAICEETSWCIPAHISGQKAGHTPLPLYQENVVDLFAAETGTTLAWCTYFLKEQMDAVTPLIAERIGHEVDKRILTPVMERDDYWWMGLTPNSSVNNWNPWIISNWITCVLIVEPDTGKKVQSLSKAMRCLDNFLNSYEEDGGCDEGPGYWNVAGGSLFDCLELLYTSSQGKINLFDEPLVKNIAAYINKAYISDPYFINFADASAILQIDPDIVFRFGQRTGNETMMGFASYAVQDKGISGNSYMMGRNLNKLFSAGEIQNYPAAEPLLFDFWLPGIQVFGARSSRNSSSGLFIAGKGGHNAESHNHNDVGNFIVYKNGEPVIIDAGVGEYRRETFSDQRYTIWTMQSQYHNLPTINGILQKEGRVFMAKDVNFSAGGKIVRFSLDIAGAYPEEAGVSSWKRSVVFNRGKSAAISENYTLREIKGEIFLTLMTPCRAEKKGDGKLILSGNGKSGPYQAEIDYHPKQLTIELEEIQIDDRRLKQVWGQELVRIKMRVKNPSSKGEIFYTIQ